ncbi:phage antirepressor KilAC domain-containing protein [Gluconobacter cerinus]|nr:BRO family protein [Gluconobacter cerinus]MBS1044534.1 phage antirepressor KilAC domain-containing protein [Gluconobacter cerinus]
MGETLVTEITLFRFENKPLEVFVQGNGDVVFDAAEVCRILELSHVGSALRILDEDEKGVHTKHTLGGEQKATFITEPGLYKLISRSRKPEAKRFDRWVRHDVLPEIRKTGGYAVQAPRVLTEQEIVAQALQITTRQVSELTAEVAMLKPQAAALKVITEADSDLGVRDAGRELQIGQNRVVDFCLKHGWACREGGKLKAAHYGLTKKYCRMCAAPYTDRFTGETKVREDFRLTRKGIERIAYHLAKQLMANREKQAQIAREMELH